ncbi:MAG: hypothetical protein J1E34_08690 [Oscillospiraceae bacterium]|nr:hypothetical protein [Oscillospiraceae bacterium]
MIKSQRTITPHQKHRENLRKTALAGGLSSFEDHNLLELLLFNVIPRRNTNKLSHKLLDRFGGIEKLLNADISEAVLVKESGEHTVMFLNILGSVCKKYYSDCINGQTNRTNFLSVDDARNYLYDLLKEEEKSVVAIVTLDAMHSIKTQRIYKKDGKTFEEMLSDATKDILSDYSAFAFIAFTHPNGILAPSKDELDFSFEIRKALLSVGIKLTEIMIISGVDRRFLSETKIFPEIFFSGQTRP